MAGAFGGKICDSYAWTREERLTIEIMYREMAVPCWRKMANIKIKARIGWYFVDLINYPFIVIPWYTREIAC